MKADFEIKKFAKVLQIMRNMTFGIILINEKYIRKKIWHDKKHKRSS